jgi:malate permease and related proteins
MLFVNIIIPVFIMVSAGFALEKAGKLDFRTLTFSSLYLFTPALVFASLIKHDLEFGLVQDLTLFMLLYTGIFLVIAQLSGKIFRMDKETRSALSLTTVVMNVGNFGLPLTYFAFGEAGVNASIMTFVIFSIPLGTLAIVIAQGTGASLPTALVNTLKIPIFHAVILAFLCKIIQAEIPLFLLRPIDILGQAAIPVMLVMLGMQLAKTRIGAWPGFLTLSSVLRLGLAPLLACLLTSILGIDGITRKVIILQTSTPSAVLPLLYSLRFGTRPDLVAGAIMVSTLLSALSLTLLLYLLG